VTGSDKQQLEGLLQARSEDMRHSRRPGRRRPVAASFVVEPSADPAVAAASTSSARSCETCGEAIGTRRLRAMPRTTLCLACQRFAEQAESAT
jgi:hypothetical protein